MSNEKATNTLPKSSAVELKVPTIQNIKINTKVKKISLNDLNQLGRDAITLEIYGPLTANELTQLDTFLLKHSNIISLKLWVKLSETSYKKTLINYKNYNLTELIFVDQSLTNDQDIRFVTEQAPQSLKKLRIRASGLSDKQFNILLENIDTTAIEELDVSESSELSCTDKLGAILPQTKIHTLNLRDNCKLNNILTICHAISDKKFPLKNLDVSNCRMRDTTQPAAMIKLITQSDLSRFILTNAVSIEGETLDKKYLSEIAQALAMNFNIIDFYIDQYFVTTPFVELSSILQRNKCIMGAQAKLADAQSTQYSRQELTKILQEDIPNNLEQAKTQSLLTAEKFPEAHKKCIKVCDEILEKCSKWIDEIKQALSVTKISVFKEKVVAESDVTINKQENEIVNSSNSWCPFL